MKYIRTPNCHFESGIFTQIRNHIVDMRLGMIHKCLFPVAGYGTRFLPATKSSPKEMLPVVNKPLIEYAVQEAVDAGLTRIGFVTGRGKRAIEDHFDKNYELEDRIRGTGKEDLIRPTRDLIDSCQFSYTRQKEMKGLGHAILTGETLIGDEPFAVVLADDLCIADGDGVLTQMVNLFNQFRCSIVAVEEVPEEHIHQYGVVSGELLENGVYRIADMIEKPSKNEAPSNLGIIGRYILTPDIFDVLRETPLGKNGELQITDALQKQANQGNVLAYQFEGRRFDCGSIDGFVDATNYCYDKFYKNGF